MLALDKVDNTLGHYVSFLRRWSPRSFRNPSNFKSAYGYRTLIASCTRFLKKDIFTLLPKIRADLSYFVPSYGSNNEKMPPSRVRYASYYHIWANSVDKRKMLFDGSNQPKS